MSRQLDRQDCLRWPYATGSAAVTLTSDDIDLPDLPFMEGLSYQEMIKTITTPGYRLDEANQQHNPGPAGVFFGAVSILTALFKLRRPGIRKRLGIPGNARSPLGPTAVRRLR